MNASELFAQLNDSQLESLERFYQYLAEWNEKINLTAIIERDDVYVKHFADSLAALPLLTKGAKIADLGCGAGFPSIPLKIAEPSLQLTLIDSVRKKVDFCNGAIAMLGLTDIAAVHTRIEDIKTRDFDFIVTRALSRLPTLLEYCLPLLKVGGHAICYKASDTDDEIAEAKNALRILGGTVSSVEHVKLLGCDARTLVVVKKVSKTPLGYPRSKNLPRTKPL